MYDNLNYRNYQITTIPIRNQFVKIEIIDINTFSRDGETKILTNLQSEKVIAEVSGQAISGSINYDANNDLRRSCNLSLVVTEDSLNVGSKTYIWLNKKIRIYVGLYDFSSGETIWNNTGEYLINNPSYSYNASTKTLSFSGADLMTKLTKARGGVLEGTEYIVRSDSSISGAMVSLLYQFGIDKYIIEENETTRNTPYEIKLNKGAEYHELLQQLAEIEPYHEMFFNVDGVFVYQKIPVDDSDVSLINDSIFDKILTQEAISLDFESVKNVVEVLGKAHAVSYFVPQNSVELNLGEADTEDLRWDGTAYYYPEDRVLYTADAGTLNDKYFQKLTTVNTRSVRPGLTTEPPPYFVITTEYADRDSLKAAANDLVSGEKYYILDEQNASNFFLAIVYTTTSPTTVISITNNGLFLNSCAWEEGEYNIYYNSSGWQIHRAATTVASNVSTSDLLTVWGIQATTYASGSAILLDFYYAPYTDSIFGVPEVTTGTDGLDYLISINGNWRDVTGVYFLSVTSLTTKTYRGDGSTLIFYGLPLEMENPTVEILNDSRDYTGRYSFSSYGATSTAIIDVATASAAPSVTTRNKVFDYMDPISGETDYYYLHGNAYGRILSSSNFLTGGYYFLTREDGSPYITGDMIYDFRLVLSVLYTSSSFIVFKTINLSFDDGSYITGYNTYTAGNVYEVNYTNIASKITFDAGYAPPTVPGTDPDNIVISYYSGFVNAEQEQAILFSTSPDVDENTFYLDNPITIATKIELVDHEETEIFTLALNGETSSGVNPVSVLAKYLALDYQNNKITISDTSRIDTRTSLPGTPDDPRTVYRCLDDGSYHWYCLSLSAWVQDTDALPSPVPTGTRRYRVMSTGVVWESQYIVSSWVFVATGVVDSDAKYFVSGDIFTINYSYPTAFAYLPPGEEIGFITPSYQASDVVNAKISINKGEIISLLGDDGNAVTVPVAFNETDEEYLYGDYFVFKLRSTVVLDTSADDADYALFEPIDNSFTYEPQWFQQWYPNKKVTILTPYLSVVARDTEATRYLIKAAGDVSYGIPEKGSYIYLYFNGTDFEVQETETAGSIIITSISFDGFNISVSAASFSSGSYYKLKIPALDFNPSIFINSFNAVKIVTIDGGGGSTYVEAAYSITRANEEYSFITGSSYYFLGNQQPRGITSDTDQTSPYNTTINGELRAVLAGGEYDNITTTALAEQRAKYELWKATRLNDSLSLSTIPVLWADVNTKVNHPSIHFSKPEYAGAVTTATDLVLLDPTALGIELGTVYYVEDEELNYVCYSLSSEDDFTYIPEGGGSRILGTYDMFWQVQPIEYIIKSLNYSIDKATSMDLNLIKFYEEYMEEKLATPVLTLDGTTLKWALDDTTHRIINIYAIANGQFFYIDSVAASLGEYAIDFSVNERLSACLLTGWINSTPAYYEAQVVSNRDSITGCDSFVPEDEYGAANDFLPGFALVMVQGAAGATPYSTDYFRVGKATNEWVASDSTYWNAQIETNRTSAHYLLSALPQVDADDYLSGFAFKVFFDYPTIGTTYATVYYKAQKRPSSPSIFFVITATYDNAAAETDVSYRPSGYSNRVAYLPEDVGAEALLFPLTNPRIPIGGSIKVRYAISQQAYIAPSSAIFSISGDTLTVLDSCPESNISNTVPYSTPIVVAPSLAEYTAGHTQSFSVYILPSVSSCRADFNEE